MRLIDADSVQLVQYEPNTVFNTAQTIAHNSNVRAVRSFLDSAPTVNAVPVVRCKDCIHRTQSIGQPNILCWNMKDNDFCSYGEKKT